VVSETTSGPPPASSTTVHARANESAAIACRISAKPAGAYRPSVHRSFGLEAEKSLPIHECAQLVLVDRMLTRAVQIAPETL